MNTVIHKTQAEIDENDVYETEYDYESEYEDDYEIEEDKDILSEQNANYNRDIAASVERNSWK